MLRHKTVQWGISMGNNLFQQAREFVNEAKRTDPLNRQGAVEKAQNALSSAYANSSEAEQQQLRNMQAELDALS